MRNENTNIEKFSGRMDKEDSGCTISINETIQNIKDVAVAGLYSYLLSKPSSWNICVQEIRNHYELSKDKVYRLMTALINLRLLEKIPVRENGRFLYFRYKLYLKPFPEKQEMVEIPINIDTQPFPEKQETEKQETENQDAYKTKINTKQRSLQNNININTREEKKSDWENHQAIYELTRKNQAKEIALSISESEKSFAAFWAAYPVKKSEARAKAAWMAQGCHNIATEILKKLDIQLKKDSQYLDEFAPHPDKYILNERWKDEIQIRAKNKSKNNNDLIDTKTW